MFARIIVDVMSSAVDKVFDYLIPENLTVHVGCKCSVPFGNRQIEGYVVDVTETTTCDINKVKSIIKVDETPLILSELIELAKFLKSTNHLRLIDTIRLCLPTSIRNNTVNAKYIKYLTVSDASKIDKFKSKQQQNVYNFVTNSGRVLYSDAVAISASATKALVDSGVLIVEQQRVSRFELPKCTDKSVALNIGQQNAYDAITKCSGFDTFLLFGVTGSGKTEVYLNCIENCLKNGKNAIMLVPEIALTPQMVKVFASRFGECIAVLHSGLTAGEKKDEWDRIYSGEARIVIGARSAIFAPVSNVGIIIIDEEHDSSYMSDSNPRYYTHDVAMFRAKYNNCPLVLGSATPNVESFRLAQNGIYKLLTLTERANKKPMPSIDIVDMSAEMRSGNNSPFSRELISKLADTISRKSQAVLFINRRGFSSFLQCRECGYVPKCVSCDCSLVYHKEDRLLKCHYCGKRYRILTKCPECGSDNIKLGGVGTEQVVELIKERFDVPVFRLDNDTARDKKAMSALIDEFSHTTPAVLVGTQMVSKGHDFAKVDFVGILDADLSLFFNDYRANEKTFQLITQVAGRAGRGEIEGKVVLQTYFPKNFVYNLCANYDYKSFFAKEINLRQTTQYPPFAKVIRVLVTSESDDVAKTITHELFIDLKNYRMKNLSDFYFLEAMKSPVSKIKDKYRYQIVTRFSVDKSKEITDYIYTLLDKYAGAKASIFVEVNPMSLS